MAIETTKGPLISALLQYDDFTIYPVNPAALAAYRKAFAHGGGKNDPGDAMLLCQYLTHYIQRLKPLRQDQPLTRTLAAMAQDRRRLVDQRTAHCNELKAVLKSYFPEVLQLEAAKIYADFVVVFLLKYPSLAAAQKAENQQRKLMAAIGARLFSRLREVQVKAAEEVVRELVAFLTPLDAEALKSLHEAGEDLIALQSLNVPNTLHRNLLSTNAILNSFRNTRRKLRPEIQRRRANSKRSVWPS